MLKEIRPAIILIVLLTLHHRRLAYPLGDYRNRRVPSSRVRRKAA